MSRVLTLPRMGETMESGRIVGWLKQPGERFRRGETIVEIESDKTVVELPALADGLLLEVLADVGADVAVGAPLCRYESGDEAGVEPMPARSAPRPEPVAPETAARRPAPETQRLRATPVARRLARESGLDLAGVAGSGRRGRIEAGDIRAPTPRVRNALLLHGFGGDGQTWAGLRASFERKGFSVSTPDLPGHGASAFEASDLAGLVASFGSLLADGEPLELVGHSLGGAVAVALARAHPRRVARLTLLAPLGLDSAVDADFILGLAAVRSVGGLSHLLRRLSPRPPALSPTQLAEMAAEYGRGRLATLAQSLVADGRQQIDILADLGALSMPVRVVWGLEDQIIPWTQVARLPSRAAIHLIAGAGHLPHWDAPQLVAELFDP